MMKVGQLIIIWTVALSGCVTLAAQACDGRPQRPRRLVLTWGAIVEPNISGFFHSGIVGGRSAMRVGGSAGCFLNIGIVRPFSVQGELLIHHKRSQFEWGSEAGQFRYWGIEIPIYAIYACTLRNGGRCFCGVGPYTEFGFDAAYARAGTKRDLYDRSGTLGVPVFRDSNTGFGIKVGYELSSGLQLTATYKASITDILYVTATGASLYPHTLSVGMAYRFGK